MLQPATKEQLLDQSVVMSDAWTILKKYANIDMDDEESWELLIEELEACCKKHNDSKYCREIMNCIQNEITRLSMRK